YILMKPLMGIVKVLALASILFAVAAAPARAEVVVIVAANNSQTFLSQSQVINIFLGRTKAYLDGTPALPVDQAEGTLARNEFYRDLLGWTAPQLRAHWSKIIFTGRGRPPRQLADDAE